MSALLHTAAKLVSARRAGHALSSFPGPLPVDLEEAYRVQRLANDLWSEGIAGWKVARVNAPWRDALGIERYVGPIYADTLFDDATCEGFPVFIGGLSAFEAELVIKVRSDAPAGKTAWSPAEAEAMMASLHWAIEIAGSPLAMLGSLGPLATIAAFGNNNGLILGDELTDLASLREADCEVRINDMVVGRAPIWAETDGPLPAFAFALAQAAQLGMPLRAGQIVTTGALTGPHPVAIGQTCEARFGKLAPYFCKVIAQRSTGWQSRATPRQPWG